MRKLLQQAPKLPPTMPVLMLGGARDEVVPRSQMQELWAIMRNRGRDPVAAQGQKSPGSAEKKARGAEDKDKDKGATDEDDDGPGPDDPKAPPRTVVDGENKYIEFGAGTHSEWLVFFFGRPR
jgi:abhydrolase domain-containing protein 13